MGYKSPREGRVALGNARKIADACFGLYEKRANDPAEYMGSDTPYMGLVDKDGGYELYDGDIRVKNGKGEKLLQFPAQDYYKRLEEKNLYML